MTGEAAHARDHSTGSGTGSSEKPLGGVPRGRHGLSG
jgi:hypothetical protein